jgi:nucleoside-diphosphate-sugar epimerase
VGILGCGYTGARLATHLQPRCEVVATRRDVALLSGLKAVGIETAAVDLETGTGLDAFEGCDAIVHLAPTPSTEGAIEAQVKRLAERTAGCRWVYGSTTGAFGRHPDHVWVDEHTPTGELQPRGARRWAYERALHASGLEPRVVRIAGIYGPGRSIFESLDRGLALFEGGPATSRIHVDDLVRLLVAQLGPKGLPLVVGCDDEPAPTLEVARFACSLAGRPPPATLTIEEAVRSMSPLARELRLAGRRCRSRFRSSIMGPLGYPTYREGVRAVWEARGAQA